MCLRTLDRKPGKGWEWRGGEEHGNAFGSLGTSSFAGYAFSHVAPVFAGDEEEAEVAGGPDFLDGDGDQAIQDDEEAEEAGDVVQEPAHDDYPGDDDGGGDDDAGGGHGGGGRRGGDRGALAQASYMSE